jgi:hypothetical protein
MDTRTDRLTPTRLPLVGGPLDGVTIDVTGAYRVELDGELYLRRTDSYEHIPAASRWPRRRRRFDAYAQARFCVHVAAGETIEQAAHAVGFTTGHVYRELYWNEDFGTLYELALERSGRKRRRKVAA